MESAIQLTGKAENLGDNDGMQVQCILCLSGHKSRRFPSTFLHLVNGSKNSILSEL